MAKTLATYTDEELAAEAQAVMEARAKDDAQHRERLVAIRAETSRREMRVRAEALKEQMRDIPEDVLAEVLGG